jgi:hypothetical protein
MIIQQQRVLNIERHLGFVRPGAVLSLGISNPNRFLRRLKEIGFSEKLEPGEAVLPAKVGSITRFNAEGAFIIHRDRPKETCYRMVWWKHVEFRGRDDTEEVWDWVDVPYQRYPRTRIEPPSVEMRVECNSNQQLMVVGPNLAFFPENHERIRLIINLFLEIFGECQIFDQEMGDVQQVPIKRLNWHILPTGEYPWERLEPLVKPMIDHARVGNRQLISDRFKTINDHQPEFYAVGRGGFSGYIVFGFSSLHIYVLESIYSNNATYVLGEDWEILSQLSKAEILNDQLHKNRLIHRVGWHKRVAELLFHRNA